MMRKVGIVVIGRNEGMRLVNCLSALICGPVPASRIIYVDSASSDGSPETAAAMGFPVVRLSADHPMSAARARNAGFDALRRAAPEIDYVQFLDGDCILAEGWIDIGARHLEQRGDLAIVCGALRERDAHTSVYKRLCAMEWAVPEGDVASCGGIFMVRAVAFEQAGGFNASLIAGEEPELCLRLRALEWGILRISDEMALHDAAIQSFAQWWRRTARGGFGASQVAWAHRSAAADEDKRLLASAAFWSGVLPLTAVTATWMHPAALGLLALYPAQVCRIALRKSPADRDAWLYAAFMMIAKAPTLIGMLRFTKRVAFEQAPVRQGFKHPRAGEDVR